MDIAGDDGGAEMDVLQSYVLTRYARIVAFVCFIYSTSLRDMHARASEWCFIREVLLDYAFVLC